MKKIFQIIPIYIVFGIISAQAQNQLKILFIGNSYTGVNNLPLTFYQFAAAMGDTIIYDSNNPGGYTFQMHSTDANTLTKINSQAWNYVVLQEQSQMPAFSPAQVQTDVYPYANALDQLIKTNDSCTKTMFYMTWGRKYGDASNCANYTPICTFEGMSGRLRESYLEMGQNFDAQVCPAGVAWRNSRAADSTLNLWSGDNSHPSLAGTYLTVCTFYASIFKKSPVGCAYTSGLTTTQAAFLQQIAANTVLDSLDVWNLNNLNPMANFSYSANGNTIQFNNQSSGANQYTWLFGEGSISNIESPSFTYADTGNYTVTLVATKSCEMDSITLQIHVGNENTGEQSFGIETVYEVFPNPADDIFYIKSSNSFPEAISVNDISGREVIKIKTKNDYLQSISLSSLEAGIYFIVIESKVLKILKK